MTERKPSIWGIVVKKKNIGQLLIKKWSALFYFKAALLQYLEKWKLLLAFGPSNYTYICANGSVSKNVNYRIVCTSKPMGGH